MLHIISCCVPDTLFNLISLLTISTSFILTFYVLREYLSKYNAAHSIQTLIVIFLSNFTAVHYSIFEFVKKPADILLK